MKTSSRVTLGTDSANISPLVPGAPRNSVVAHKHSERVELKKKVISWRDSLINYKKKIFLKRIIIYALDFTEEKLVHNTPISSGLSISPKSFMMSLHARNNYFSLVFVLSFFIPFP